VCTLDRRAGGNGAADTVVANDFVSRHADRTEVWHEV